MNRSFEGFWRPAFNPGKCRKCGVCLEVCSGYHCYWIRADFGPEDRLPLGRVLDAFVAWSADESVRCAGSSGGIVSQLIISAMEEGLIDGAVVCRSDNNDPFYSRMMLVKSREEVLKAAKSKYAPSTMDAALQKLLREPGKHRYVVVGLPCQVASVKAATNRMPGLAEKIICCIGLFCGRVVSANLGRLQVALLKINTGDVGSIEYKGKPWWNWDFKVIHKSSACITKTPFRNTAFAKIMDQRFFTQQACLLCPDALALSSDISCGNAWFSSYAGQGDGKSLLLIRSERGRDFIKSAWNRGELITDLISPGLVLEAQPHARWIYDSVNAQFLLRVKLSLPVPEGWSDSGKIRFLKLLGAA